MSRLEENFNRVCEYLDSQEWEYDVVDESHITFEMGIRCQLKRCRVIVSISENDILTRAIAPINANSDTQNAVAEFITRANYNLKLGGFDMDYSDGEVRYKTCLTCVDRTPSLREVEIFIDATYLMLRRYGDALLKNMLGFGNPEEDIKAIIG